MHDDKSFRALQQPPGWARIAVLYGLGIASLSCAVIGGVMAWEAVTWQPTTVSELPPMLLQFCIGGAAATASGLLAISCLVPAMVFHAERRIGASVPRARVVRGPGFSARSSARSSGCAAGCSTGCSSRCSSVPPA